LPDLCPNKRKFVGAFFMALATSEEP